MSTIDTAHQLDLDTVRRKLSEAKSGKQYWRSLDELSESKEFHEMLHREFPQQASVWDDGFSRRSFLKLMGASLALAGLSACTKQPDEKIVPYVKAPEEIVPGKPLYFATAIPFNGYAQGVLVRSDMGRPTKIEGNPAHPATLGSADIFTQASILSLYDPDRSRVVSYRGSITTWDRFLEAFSNELQAQQVTGGAGFRILTETVTSPTLIAQIQSILQKYPRAKWYQYTPVAMDNSREGLNRAFGASGEVRYDFTRADIILSLDADFLCMGPSGVRYERDFAARRRVVGDKKDMNRLYVAESAPTLTGAMADHRLALKPAHIEALAYAVARELGVNGVPSGNLSLDERTQRFVKVVAEDLQSHRGRSLVIAGEYQHAGIHALAHAINTMLGNLGETVLITDSVEAQASASLANIRELTFEMKDGKVEMLLILGANPAYDAPADLGFDRAMEKVPVRVKLGLYEDETSSLCHWHVPESHALETWSDARAFDGTTTIIQPLIAPLYNSISRHTFLEEVLGNSAKSDYEVVQSYWKRQLPAGNFEHFWTQSLNDGIIANSTQPSKSVSIKSTIDFSNPSTQHNTGNGLEILFRPDPTIWDGQFANNGWLQELPKPFTKLTWDNAALISPSTAERLGLANMDVVELQYRGKSLRAPIWILPGQAADVITVHLGYGRTHVGRIGRNAGFNAYTLRTSDSPWHGSGLEVKKTGDRYPLSSTQQHFSMEHRAPVREATLAEYLENPNFAEEIIPPPAKDMTLYPPYKYDDYAWGMTIDLNACTGCNACAIACQSENNIPIVGKEQVAKSREMNWIHVDTYFSGDMNDPDYSFQPRACVHCENAPCEVVCPVNATVHDHEGLNVMVYNRCVGTRYCSNNCPYKVRRFNFLEFSGKEPDTYEMRRNPDVTVRSRGVMEKCTFCIQRISAARIEAKKDDRAIQDGEVVTACQSACPAQAIVFGNINDKQSQVSRMKAEPRDYGLLAEINTRPRLTYLAKLRNPNPQLAVSEEDLS